MLDPNLVSGVRRPSRLWLVLLGAFAALAIAMGVVVFTSALTTQADLSNLLTSNNLHALHTSHSTAANDVVLKQILAELKLIHAAQ